MALSCRLLPFPTAPGILSRYPNANGGKPFSLRTCRQHGQPAWVGGLTTAVSAARQRPDSLTWRFSPSATWQRPRFSSSPELMLCDEQGTKLDSAREGGTAAGFDGKHDWKLVIWKMSKIPQN